MGQSIVTNIEFDRQTSTYDKPTFIAPYGWTCRDASGNVWRQEADSGNRWRRLNNEFKPPTIIWAHENWPLDIIAGNPFGTITAGPTISNVNAVNQYLTAFHFAHTPKLIYGMVLGLYQHSSGTISLKTAIRELNKVEQPYSHQPAKIFVDPYTNEEAVFSLTAYDPAGTGMINNDLIFIPMDNRSAEPLSGLDDNKIWISSKWGSTYNGTILCRRLLDFRETGTNVNRQDRIMTATEAYSADFVDLSGDVITASSNGTSAVATATFGPANINWGLVVDL